MNTNTTNEQAEKAAGWISRLLTGWGIPGSIARIAAGAIIGALAAAYTLTTSGCTASYSQTAGGDIQYQGSVIPLPVDTTK